MKNYSFFRLLFILVLVSSCRSAKVIDFSTQTPPKAPDYNLESSWAILPHTYTEAFKNYASKELDTLTADVFYVYPTLNTENKDSRWNVPIDDEKQRLKVIEKASLFQASAFATAGKVYVPFYRQAHLRSYLNLDNGGQDALDLAYTDVKAAFETYLKKYNNGRPIIIASHSQGTTHMQRILEEYFDGKPLQNKLVAAYLVGIGVKPNRFKTIQPMTSANATGGFVSWNTYKKGHYPRREPNWYDGCVATNPITWDDTETTTLEQHKGFLYSNGKLYPNALKVTITDGLVWSTNPKFPMRFFMSPLKNYHVGDINLFWQDINENVVLRVNTYNAATN